MQLIDVEIFQPNYIVEVESGVREDLLQEAVKDSQSESFRRAFLLSVFPDQQTRILERRAVSILENITRLVEGIIEAEQVAALKLDLKGFIRLAYTNWKAIQRLHDRFEPNMYYTVDDGIDWGALPLDDHEQAKNEGDSAATQHLRRGSARGLSTHVHCERRRTKASDSRDRAYEITDHGGGAGGP